jgi:hypothetical protein
MPQALIDRFNTAPSDTSWPAPVSPSDC